MVSFVIISHSAALARGVCEEAHIMAPDVCVLPAGGTLDGEIGTSIDVICDAIEKAYTDDGVILLMDMGSAVMTASLAIEELDRDNIVMADCPISEGAVTGAVLADSGASLSEILEELKDVANQKKLDFTL